MECQKTVVLKAENLKKAPGSNAYHWEGIESDETVNIIIEGGISISTDGGPISTEGGLIFTAGGDISTRGGDISTEDGSIYTDGGSIFTEGGLISTDGGPISTEGGLIFTAGGDISTEGGDIFTEGGDIFTAGGDISTRGGDISTEGGSIFTQGGSMECGVLYWRLPSMPQVPFEKLKIAKVRPDECMRKYWEEKLGRRLPGCWSKIEDRLRPKLKTILERTDLTETDRWILESHLGK